MDTLHHYLKAYVKYNKSDNQEIKVFAEGDSFDVMDLLSEDSDSQFNSRKTSEDENEKDVTANQNKERNSDKKNSKINEQRINVDFLSINDIDINLKQSTNLNSSLMTIQEPNIIPDSNTQNNNKS